ncbi:FadR/GntR family transcriptional regulator [Kriegella aquimaris]|uniref:DNA-binding transcriptional regulator, FadR family n=1 Tax=Kriegella aquimaris TaxID=192904 RepID=A0A1G9VCW8_9FLAO|nr:GntR family transcriptional regulator [Kriegella aquimaris]SDM70042.1 DNA-binding transcriptional regulator, FadR family [Kriegella aquimaris]
MEKNHKIKPVKIESMVDQVENNLRDYIKKQGFKPGDTLPTENELASSMNVSRNVIREALSRFRMLGLIVSNKKKGIQLKKFNLFPALERVLDPTVLDENTLHELFELRIMLEVGMADALFRNISSEDILELRKIIASFESSSTKRNKIDYEIDFHSYLYKISKNETLFGFQKYLKIVFDYVLEIEAKSGANKIDEPKVDHSRLVKCLEEGTVAEFRQLMNDHFLPYYSLGIIH